MTSSGASTVGDADILDDYVRLEGICLDLPVLDNQFLVDIINEFIDFGFSHLDA